MSEIKNLSRKIDEMTNENFELCEFLEDKNF